MKKISIVVFTLLFGTLTPSCEIGFLDNEVYSTMQQENFYKTLDDYERALAGCYYYISGRGPSKDGNYCAGIPVMGQAGTDETFVSTSKSAGWDYAVELDQYGVLTSTNVACQEVWINHYTGINAALEITDRVWAMSEEELDNESRLRGIAAEASFLQALWYFNLVRIYGGVPLKFKASRPEDDMIDVSRNSIEEVYAHIFELLEYAETYLPDGFIGIYGRATRNSAYALRAKANLQVASSMNLLTIPEAVKLGGINAFDWTLEGKTRGETIRHYYQEARDYARLVLDYFAPDYLNPNFTDCFYPSESTKEILFEGVTSTGLSVEMGGWFGSLYGPNGASALGGGQQVILGNNVISMNQFTFYNSGTANAPVWESYDKRFAWTWACYRIPANMGGAAPVVAPAQIYGVQAQIGKFRIDQPASYNQDRTPVNIPILRTAEVCLIHAEAQAELDHMDGLGITADALEFLNVVRTRAGVDAYTASSIREVIPYVAYTSTQTRGNNEIRGWTDDTDIGHFRRAILNERSLELIGEGHRWHDLVRMGVLDKVVPAVTTFSNAFSGVTNKQTIPNRNIQSYHIFRPLPSRELSIHGEVMIQNFGYR